VKLIEEIAQLIRENTRTSYKGASAILAKVREVIVVADIDNEKWHKTEFEAYCAGKNDKLKAVWEALEEK